MSNKNFKYSKFNNKTRNQILSNIITPNAERNILYVPSDFLSSERYYHGRTTMAAGEIDIRGKNLKSWFLEKKNIDWMTKEMFLLYLKNDYKHIKLDSSKYSNSEAQLMDWPSFQKIIPKWMKEYSKSESVYKYVEDPIGPYTSDKSWLYKYYIEALSKINREFFKKYYYFIKNSKKTETDFYEYEDELPGLTGKPDWNPYKASLTVGTKDEFQIISPDEVIVICYIIQNNGKN